MKRRWDAWSTNQRILAVLAGALSLATGVLACYFVAANLLLKTPLLRDLINDGPESTSVEYSSAFSPWPGRLQVNDLRIRDRGRASEWMIALDEGRAHVGLLDLLHRRFHPTHIRGKGLVILVRSRLTPEEATPGRLLVIPPIPGFPAPPLRRPGQTASPPTGREWTIWLENVDVDGVREIWVDEYHYAGDATLTGGMLLHPGSRFEVFPASLEVRSGTLRVNEETLAVSVRASLAAVIHPYDLREESGDAALRFLTGTGRATGRIESIHFLNVMLNTPPALSLQGGTGDLSAELSLDQGSGKGALDFSVKEVEAVMPDATMTGESEGQLRLVHLDLNSGLAEFAGSHLGVRDVVVKRGDETPWSWWGNLELVAGDLRTGPPRVLYGHLDLRAQDARPLYRLMNAQIPLWAEGLLRMKGVTATADVALGKSFVDVKSLDAQGHAFHILGRYHAAPGSSEGLFLIDSGALALGVWIGGGTSKLQLVGAKSWYREQIAREGTPLPRVARSD
jgi:hypothetical protein